MRKLCHSVRGKLSVNTQENLEPVTFSISVCVFSVVVVCVCVFEKDRERKRERERVMISIRCDCLTRPSAPLCFLHHKHKHIDAKAIEQSAGSWDDWQNVQYVYKGV